MSWDLSLGSSCELILRRGMFWAPAKVSEVHRNMAVIAFENGHDRLRVGTESLRPPPPDSDSGGYDIGDAVEVNIKGDFWCAMVVEAPDKEGVCTVKVGYTSDVVRFHTNQMRPSMVYDNGKWVATNPTNDENSPNHAVALSGTKPADEEKVSGSPSHDSPMSTDCVALSDANQVTGSGSHGEADDGAASMSVDFDRTSTDSSSSVELDGSAMSTDY